ncbi:hypothetical protein RO3G_13653 [Rhizopus delemar RA 99-880]|uniref:Uncharacterized protein n=1 Tax=Rhizopus delemar (strain RA 99-880 / ATCC MYA-4621 / FGSC 9543 / NRRL 43880) TaxID=246409 RepID=I1CKG2_RHIO9|nr:hypothetical protein RO3G_13653 [Rhizopus delemar RA 99-880]|eukprot:EIE88942.1 hypothetical protein RO3G_13653 [Rhizopus delemar RA 99-880]
MSQFNSKGFSRYMDFVSSEDRMRTPLQVLIPYLAVISFDISLLLLLLLSQTTSTFSY